MAERFPATEEPEQELKRGGYSGSKSGDRMRPPAQMPSGFSKSDGKDEEK